jgi:hypothetical protein
MVNILRGSTLGTMWSKLKQNTDQDYDTIEELNPALFSIKANAYDNPTWNQAMGGERILASLHQRIRNSAQEECLGGSDERTPDENYSLDLGVQV